ncbi:GntR family transcriptional regulator [Paenibacillus xerothermodurans]|uniref:GntR family transcriptional regulator n=1 Tax=Paenibacillus xerothermodurans TaxID=1977292 RepID=A0A2W1NWS9_PAEXE|nr:GntR family transcriptional regulator [Paenibacillus xerothermodurans]PZE22176.1 GntR family transcriptional regulator [Paenibacillus xerothermodurans]
MSRQTESAYQYMKQKILDGTYKPSQKLIESQLAEEIGVSRNTVKKALLKLEQDNLVKIENNKGATIKYFTLEEVINYLEIREVLEGLVAATAAKTITDDELNRLEQTLEQMAIHLQDNNFDEYSALNKQFHSIIYKASKKDQAVELINMIKTQLIRYQFRTILVPGRNENSLMEHKRILQALIDRDEDAAANAAKAHIYNVRQTIERNYHYLV